MPGLGEEAEEEAVLEGREVRSWFVNPKHSHTVTAVSTKYPPHPANPCYNYIYIYCLSYLIEMCLLLTHVLYDNVVIESVSCLLSMATSLI